METNSQKRQHSKFNPPLKKTVPLSGNTSCSSATSWSLPPTQTHTVLSYCEQEELQSQEKCSATKHEAVGQTSRKSLVRSNRKYDYGISTNKTTRRPVQYHPKTCTGAGSNVYDYCLTPSKQVRLQRCKRKRTKEQVSNLSICYVSYSIDIKCRLKSTGLSCTTLPQ